MIKNTSDEKQILEALKSWRLLGFVFLCSSIFLNSQIYIVGDAKVAIQNNALVYNGDSLVATISKASNLDGIFKGNDLAYNNSKDSPNQKLLRFNIKKNKSRLLSQSIRDIQIKKIKIQISLKTNNSNEKFSNHECGNNLFLIPQNQFQKFSDIVTYFLQNKVFKTLNLNNYNSISLTWQKIVGDDFFTRPPPIWIT